MGVEIGFRGVLPDQILVLQAVLCRSGRPSRPDVGHRLCTCHRGLHLDRVSRPSPI